VATRQSAPVSAAVEGLTDEAVLRRLVSEAEGAVDTVYGKQGKSYLRHRIAGYNNAARFSPWVVLVDLNAEEECAPALRRVWLPKPTSNMCFRVAVRATESWLLADPERLASYLGIRRSLVPRNPDDLDRPKEAVVELARRSRRRAIREDMVPRPDSGRRIGPAYTSQLVQFVGDRVKGWRPAVAAHRSDSLRRCLQRIAELVGLWRTAGA